MQEVTTSYQVTKGDQLQFEFTIQTLWSEEQVKSALDQINTDPRLRVIGHEIVAHDWKDVGVYGEYAVLLDKLIVKVEVLQNPFPVMILIAMIIGVTGLYFLSLSLDKVYLIAKGVIEGIGELPGAAKAGLSMLTLVGGALVGYLALRKYLFK